MFFFVGTGIHRASGQDISVDIPTQMTIFQTLLTFERTNRLDSTGAVRISIVYQSKFRKSMIAHDEIIAYIRAGASKNISLRLSDIDLDAVNPEEKIKENSVSVLLVCPLRSVSIRTITNLSRRHHLLSMTVVPEYVKKGITVGIDIRNAKPLILINRAAGKLEHADFDSRLFNFVRFLEGEE